MEVTTPGTFGNRSCAAGTSVAAALAMAGTAVAVSLYWLIVAAALGGYFIYSAVMEERYMAGIFPDTYPRYQQETKMLIPYIV